MYIINLHYIRPIEDVEENLAGHIEYLEHHYSLGHFICSGRKEPRTGGIILCNAQSEAEVKQIINEDPFYQQNIAKYELTQFYPSKFASAFEGCVKGKSL